MSYLRSLRLYWEVPPFVLGTSMLTAWRGGKAGARRRRCQYTDQVAHMSSVSHL
jgi:hypothetical protein